MEIAEDIHYLEPCLVAACNALHHHVHEMGLVPHRGKWAVGPLRGSVTDSTERQFLAQRFPKR